MKLNGVYHKAIPEFASKLLWRRVNKTERIDRCYQLSKGTKGKSESLVSGTSIAYGSKFRASLSCLISCAKICVYIRSWLAWKACIQLLLCKLLHWELTILTGIRTKALIFWWRSTIDGNLPALTDVSLSGNVMSPSLPPPSENWCRISPKIDVVCTNQISQKQNVLSRPDLLT